VFKVPSACRHSVLANQTQRSITKMLLFISSIFIICTLPSHVVRIYATMAGQETENLKSLQQIFMHLNNFHFAINFFLYSICGSHFRKCLNQLVDKTVHRARNR
ncbi:unnamed protein product, partial [Meganyctiphanes norvegica]